MELSTWDLITTLFHVNSVEEHGKYKAVTLCPTGLDCVSYVWEGNEYLGSIASGFDYGFVFELKTFIEAGMLDTLSKDEDEVHLTLQKVLKA